MPMDSGKSRKMEEMIREINNGQHDKKYLLQKYEATYARIYRAVDHCIEISKEIPDAGQNTPLKVIVWFGKAGQGKSHSARQYLIDNHMKKAHTQTWAKMKKGWWDGYNGHQTILFDDFRGSAMEPQQWMNLVDGEEDQLPIKGSHKENKATLLLFTCPDHPINWWKKWYAKTPDDNNWNQIKRRLVDHGQVFQVADRTSTEVPVDFWDEYKERIENVKIF